MFLCQHVNCSVQYNRNCLCTLYSAEMALNYDLTQLLKRKENKLCGPQSASEVYRLSYRYLSAKFSANFC
jgi:hypothetical protein